MDLVHEDREGRKLTVSEPEVGTLAFSADGIRLTRVEWLDLVAAVERTFFGPAEFRKKDAQ